ncbi:DUF1515 domain-containing protein [Pararhizobium sp. BT-229]|nr:DUF1515 domain-containing protein [Pararhizobium sp. BT-229]MCV9967284.1 DUF1515 domain-containing protein [Pararhizobium sp. BT-229]
MDRFETAAEASFCGRLGVVGITAAALAVTFADVIKRVLTMGRF